MYYKFCIILDQIINNQENQTLLNLITFLSYKSNLINKVNGNIDLNHIFTTIKSCLDLSIFPSDLFSENDIKFISYLYNKYKNISLYKFLILCKIPDIFIEDIEILKILDVIQAIDNNNNISSAINILGLNNNLMQCINQISLLHYDFIKEFHLYII